MAVVTGATQGLGRAIAITFASEGASVVVCARGDDFGPETVEAICAAGGEGLFVRADASKPADVERLVATARDRFDHLDILVSNVATIATGTAVETSIQTWHEVLDATLGSAFLLAKYGMPSLAEAGGGSVVLIGGELGLVGAKKTAAYCAAKGGVINLTRALAVDGSAHDIRVNCLCPGPVETPLLRRWLDSSEDPEALEEAQTKPLLIKRIARADEIAQVALFLASEAASYVTGAIVLADGGLTAWYGM